MGRFAIGRSDARFTSDCWLAASSHGVAAVSLVARTRSARTLLRITSFHGVGLSARGMTRLNGPHSPVQKTTAPPGC